VSIRLSSDESWAVLEKAHTGILTTLRADGVPIALPIWFVVLDRTIAFGTPSHSKKLVRIRHDPRASFLVESGERWPELVGVHVTGRVEIVTDAETIARIRAGIDAKYASYRTPPTSMPQTARERYDDRTNLRLVPDDRMLTWDNHRIALEGR
jgi:PPOX class probable F420-dependent enzyme